MRAHAGVRIVAAIGGPVAAVMLATLGFGRVATAAPSYAAYNQDAATPDIVERWAPKFWHDINVSSWGAASDFVPRVDYDGNWNGANNNLSSTLITYRTTMGSTVYWSLVEGRTHAFIGYYVYHVASQAREGFGTLGAHEHDWEGVVLAVHRESGQLDGILTNQHGNLHAYLPPTEPATLGIKLRRAISNNDGNFSFVDGATLGIGIESGSHSVQGRWNDRCIIGSQFGLPSGCTGGQGGDGFILAYQNRPDVPSQFNQYPNWQISSYDLVPLLPLLDRALDPTSCGQNQPTALFACPGNFALPFDQMNSAGDDAADMPWVWGVAGVITTACTGRSVLLHPGFVFASKFEWPQGRFDPDSRVNNEYLARLPTSCLSTLPKDFDASPADLAIVARNSLFLNDGVQVRATTGYAGVGNQGRSQTLLGSRATVGSIWSDAPVTLRSYATVIGPVQSSSIITAQAGATSGSQLPNVVPVFRSLPRLDTVTFPPLGVDVVLEPNVERSLTPAAYGDVHVKSRSVLVLTKGTYYFRSLFIEPQSSLSVDDSAGPVRVLIRNGLTFRGQAVRRTGFGVPALLLFVDGTGGAVIDASFQGSVVAPRGPVSVASAASHTGSFLGKDVSVHQWTTIFHMAFPGEWLPETVSCTDGFFNGTETGIDCGGTCQPCAPN